MESSHKGIALLWRSSMVEIPVWFQDPPIPKFLEVMNKLAVPQSRKLVYVEIQDSRAALDASVSNLT
jgi:hypothetical protein